MARRSSYQLTKTKSNRCKARVTVHYPDGTADRPARTFKLKRDAVAWAMERAAMSAKGALNAPFPLERFFNEYLESKTTLQPKTLEDYERVLRRFLRVHPGRNLADITVADVQRFLNRLEDGRGVPLSERSKRLAFAVLRNAFRYAVRARYLSAAPLPDAPRVSRTSVTEDDVLTADELRRFVVAARSDEMYAFIVLLVTTGIRLGEALALTPKDIDGAGVLTISKSAQDYDRLIPTVKASPKTASGSRSIMLVSELASLLRSRDSDERLFPYTYAQIRSTLRRVAKGAGLAGKEVRPHLLRHTACTTLLNEGVPIMTVVATMGHKDAAFTLNTYAKFLKENRDAVPRAWDAFFGHDSGIV